MTYKNYTGQLSTVTCIVCGITFGIPTTYDDYLQEKRKTFYCPNGHGQNYINETEARRYKRLYEAEKNCCRIKRNKLENMHHRYNGLKGYVAKIKKQIPMVN